MRLSALIKPAALGLTALVSAITLPNAQAAPITWNGWTFDYTVGVNNEGLALKNVKYQTHTLLKKISLPVIRNNGENTGVGDYLNTPQCAFVTQLGGTFSPIPWANNATLSQRQFTKDGKQWYEIGVLKKVGIREYFQAYYLSSDGLFDAHLYTRGNQCPTGSAQYADWRVDLDIDGAASDTIYPRNVLGKFAIAYNEFNGKTLGYWQQRDNVTNTSVTVFDAGIFAHPDGNYTQSQIRLGYNFADFFGRLYKAAEDVALPANTLTYPLASAPFYTPENINIKDPLAWHRSANYIPVQLDGANGWSSNGLSLVPSWVANSLPDYVVDEIQYDNGYFYALIRNQANFPSLPNTKPLAIGFYVDGVYKTWTGYGAPILPPGQSTRLQTTDLQRYIIPAGIHKVTGWLDDLGRIAETNETNNQLSQTITVP